ncbi:MAG: ABC transporter ATP-binding protein [Anaerolineae bacterium]
MTAPAHPLLEIRAISKAFDGVPVLRDVSCEVAAGEIVCLLGPSGCGKTTLLRIIAGLEQADTGELRFDGRNLAATPVHRRGFGFMFQDFALFPHRNVAENVAFGLRMTGQPTAAIRARVAELLALVGLEGYEQRRVYELSGGQQQRVALARSLAPQPALLLLDEPLGSLDRTLREELMGELRGILKRAPNMTAVYVTHDQQEAFAVADRVIIMNAGRIEQTGSPVAVYQQPASAFVAHFLGMQNLLAGQCMASSDAAQIVTALGVLRCAACRCAGGDAVTALLRPDAATLATDSHVNRIEATVQEISFRGSQVKLTVTAAGLGLQFELPGSAAAGLPAPGQPVQLALDPAGISLLPAEHAF